MVPPAAWFLPLKVLVKDAFLTVGRACGYLAADADVQGRDLNLHFLRL